MGDLVLPPTSVAVANNILIQGQTMIEDDKNNENLDTYEYDDADLGSDSGSGVAKTSRDKQSRDWMLTIRAAGHAENDVKTLFEKRPFAVWCG